MVRANPTGPWSTVQTWVFPVSAGKELWTAGDRREQTWSDLGFERTGLLLGLKNFMGRLEIQQGHREDHSSGPNGGVSGHIPIYLKCRIV